MDTDPPGRLAMVVSGSCTSLPIPSKIFQEGEHEAGRTEQSYDLVPKSQSHLRIAPTSPSPQVFRNSLEPFPSFRADS